MVRRLILLTAMMAAACGDDSGLPDARIIDGVPPGGTVSLSWVLGDDGAPVTCDQVGAVTVTLVIVPVDAPFGQTEAFSCTSGRGTTGVIPVGAYNVTATVGGGTSMAAPVQRFGVVVRSGLDTALDEVSFAIDASGGLRFRIAAQGATSNCSAAPGADIDAVGLRLATSAGVCVPTSFSIGAGASLPASTVVDDCGTAARATCIDADQDISVAAAVSGRYRLSVDGVVGGTACWTTRPAVRVPAAGTEAMLGTLNLVRSSAAGCAAP